jgi:hypothetical protein
MVMTPAQEHMHVLVLFRAGILPIMTVGDPGVQGVVTGTHGIGVSTPSAAAVAAATVGLARELHIPNGGMFTIGLKSMMFAAGGPSAFVRFTGNTIRLAGDAPKLHAIMAPIFTCWGMSSPPAKLGLAPSPFHFPQRGRPQLLQLKAPGKLATWQRLQELL